MTQQDVDLDDSFIKQEAAESSMEQQQQPSYTAEVVSLPALSKRNTHVTELTAKKPGLAVCQRSTAAGRQAENGQNHVSLELDCSSHLSPHYRPWVA